MRILILVTALAATAAAGSIPEAAGVQGGLIVHLGCGDGRTTAALRVNERFIVQGLDTDPAAVQAAREHIHSLGLYGPVTANTFDGRHLPYVENFVNLVVAERLGACAPERLAFLSSAKCTNEENYLVQKMSRGLFGTNNVDHCARL